MIQIDNLDTALVGKGCLCGRNPLDLTSSVLIIEVDLIGTPTLLMVGRENRYLVAPVSLLCGRIPLDIILTTRFSPNWDLDRLDGLRTFDIGNNHIKTALAQVLVTDLQGSRRRCEQGGCCSGYALGWCILVLIVEMNMVVAASIFMVGFIDRNLIGTICLSGS